jgi:hypothetical protein
LIQPLSFDRHCGIALQSGQGTRSL